MKHGWEIKKLGEVFDLQMGKTPSRDNTDYWGGSNVWISIADLKNKYIGESKEHITDEAVVDSKIKKVNAGVVIMSFKLTVGRAAITTTDVYTNEAIMAFNVKEGYYLLPDYIYYYLKGYKWTGTNKAVMGLTLNKATMSQNMIVIPPLSIQERIVSELDGINGILEKKREQIKELDALAQSIFYDMFGDPIQNEKGWEVRKLKDSVTEMFLGPFGSALKTDCYVEKDESFCMVYEQKHAIKKTLDLDTHYINKEKFDSLSRFEVHAGDFIMSCRGTVGEIYQLPYNAPQGIIHPSLMKIRIKEEVYSPKFFIRLLTCVIKNESTSGNCVQMAITAKELGAKNLPLPPLPLQQAFAEKIEAIEKQKELVKRSIAEVETLLASRMQHYFEA